MEQFGKPVPGSLPTIIRSFKSATTKRINELRGRPGEKFWQRNYSEHVVRSEDDLRDIGRYIENNPLPWELDSLNLGNSRFPV
ncbi:MAG: transposase [Desulfobulbaceae bacterium]|nr:transposase [Desulfobulbaceae bacterium]